MSVISISAEDENHLFGTVEPTKGVWYPIETAPKEDGSEYLVWDGVNGWLVEYGSYGGMEPKHNGCGCCVIGVEATHWMPLPEPPK
jgi:hypothetical protein